MRREETKKEAARIAAGLIESASRNVSTDPELAKRQAALARRISLKFNLRFDWRLKRFYCHGCKRLIFPGLNARVRLGPERMLLVTCLDCNFVNRKRIPRARLNTERRGLTKSPRA